MFVFMKDKIHYYFQKVRRSGKWPVLLFAVIFIDLVMLAGVAVSGSAEQKDAFPGLYEVALVKETPKKDLYEGEIMEKPIALREEPDEASDRGLDKASNEAVVPVVIHICGAVAREGVYTLQEGDRVADALDMAGGYTEEADRYALNLAMKLADGMKIYVPRTGEEWNEEVITSPAGTEDRKVNINTADINELTKIPGVGAARAEAIIAFREKEGRFASSEDLMKIPGIKEGMFAKMEPYVRVR